MRYPIRVDKELISSRQYVALRKMGLTDNGASLTGDLTRKQKNKLISYCQRNRIRYHINNDFGKRSNYRAVYFESNRPVIGDRYFCAYCGMLIPKRKVTVDHIYPVYLADTDFKVQKKLSQHGWESINDVENLVAACKRCNSRKSAKTGFWIFRGFLGKSNSLWIIRHILRLIIPGIAIYYYYITYMPKG